MPIDGERVARRGGQGLLDVARAGALIGDVGLVVGVERLHGGLALADAGLGLGVLRTGALTEEGGKGDRGEDADDQNDDQELDKGEALFLLGAEAHVAEHVGVSFGWGEKQGLNAKEAGPKARL